MAGTPGVDFPEQRDVVDVVVGGRGEVLVSWVESADDAEIVVTVGEDRDRRRAALPVGERLELVWRAAAELRSLPVELMASEPGATPVWRLRPTGPATRGQRRSAVRAPLSVPVRMTVGTAEVPGTTVDVSEAGTRVAFEVSAGRTDPTGGSDPEPAVEDAPEGRTGDGLPGAGAVVPLRLSFVDDEVVCQAEVIRQIRHRDRRPELTFRFIGLHEKTEDLIRRQVFAELRSLRARGLD
ncbi:PilZ domain-containing protein [Geodermatophilus obscurus]|uniref:PilZ domain-containing protein n=1 Tax=Geodermatophilus obscurus TaxID=1861 RepID=A0A1M7V0P2_9ACTN|nr:PilZ domain-containing protein [Geodermatophilus obscurus]SHN88745.1 PilZ domain-containing protein [Geodermatophilus obscurus]